MPYTIKDPPDWLKDLPEGAVKIGVNAFNAVFAEKEDEDQARQAVWAAIKEKYEKATDGEWRAKGGIDPIEEEFNLLMRLGQARNTEGTAWDVTICEPGPTKNGWFLPEDALRQGAALFEGADVNIYELPGTNGATHVPDDIFELKSLLTKNKAGWLDNVRYVAGEGLKAVLHFVDSAKWLGKNLAEGIKKGARVYGLSYDAPVRAKKAEREGKTVMELIKFLAVDSVDIVTRPAAGGKFNRAIASQMAHNNKQEVIMNRQELLALIQEKRPDLLKGKDLEKITDDEVTGLARMAMEPAAKPHDPGDGGTGDGNDNPAPGKDAASKDDLKRMRCEMALEKTLGKSDLPEHAQDRIRAVFSEEIDGEKVVKIFAYDALDSAIAAEKDYLAKTSTPAEDPIAASRITGGLGTLDKMQMAVDRAFGLTKENMETFARMDTLEHQPFFQDRIGPGDPIIRSAQDFADFDRVPAFRGLREMYAYFTGDPEVTGFFNKKRLPPDLRSRMDITSSTFTYVLGNTLNRRLVREYREASYLENLILSVKKSVKDFRTQEAIKVGGFPDLEVVNPETTDYQEIVGITDEEVTYAMITRGNLLTVTRVTIINDDISIVQRGVSKLGRAARRTHGKYVWGFYINNGTCVDGTAVFTGGHGNLGSSALDHSTALVAYKALAGMTEKDSGEYLGLLDGQNVVVNLVGPTALMESIKRIETEDFYYSSNDLTTKLPNPLKGLVKGHTLSLLNADADDWYMTAPPGDAELVEMGYLNGREEPEMFVADMPTSEQVFVADKIRHKIRHEYAGAPIDYVGAYKAAV